MQIELIIFIIFIIVMKLESIFNEIKQLPPVIQRTIYEYDDTYKRQYWYCMDEIWWLYYDRVVLELYDEKDYEIILKRRWSFKLTSLKLAKMILFEFH